ncbi:Poly [ADP-ribose] polymerase 4 [Nymphon striatum]|nr:Poly [ADP-ribose] polymerase 4 [Nymphon striatum]
MKLLPNSVKNSVFSKQTFFLDLTNDDKCNLNAIKEKILNNGGFVTTNPSICTAILKSKSKGAKRSSSHPVLYLDYLDACLLEKRCVDSNLFAFPETEEEEQFSNGVISTEFVKPSEENEDETNLDSIHTQPYMEACIKNYELLKSFVFKDADRICVVELHAEIFEKFSAKRFAIIQHMDYLSESGSIRNRMLVVEDGVTAERLYEMLYDQLLLVEKMERHYHCPPICIGTESFQQYQQEWNANAAVLSPKILDLLNYLWQEAHGELQSQLATPLQQITINKINEAEGILLSIRERQVACDSHKNLCDLSHQFYNLIPHHDKACIETLRDVVKKQELCQLIRDVITVSETTGWDLKFQTQSALYRALKCQIEYISEDDQRFYDISDLIYRSQHHGNSCITIDNIYSVNRMIEAKQFNSKIRNIKRLFHASGVANIVGILSRGLLMPKKYVEDMGGKRTDAGMLGSGIYFSDSASTSLKYANCSKIKGTRFLLVHDVALGKIFQTSKFDTCLDCAPEGYDSTHGVMDQFNQKSDFKDDEFVIYDTNQQIMSYLVEFHIEDDTLIPRNPLILNSNEPEQMEINAFDDSNSNNISVDDAYNVTNPNDKVVSGLQNKKDEKIPLNYVSLQINVIDSIGKVTIYQEYKNYSNEAIEAKYVFPLDESAAVCGFEAFINEKHVIGEVKEKETAHKEYKKAISEGHGAYLMDEEKPVSNYFTVDFLTQVDFKYITRSKLEWLTGIRPSVWAGMSQNIFMVHVGNLPAGATVIIKITYVIELHVEGDYYLLKIPNYVAPWDSSACLDKENQVLGVKLSIRTKYYVNIVLHNGNFQDESVKDYIANFNYAIGKRLRVEYVYLIFDRYYDYSTKSVTRGSRATGVSRAHHLQVNSKLPAQKILLTSSKNKKQLMQLIVDDFVQDKKFHEDNTQHYKLVVTGADPVPIEISEGGVVISRADLSTSHEEADNVIVQQVLSCAAENAESKITVVADDTDVFVLLLYYHHMANLKNVTTVKSKSNQDGKPQWDVEGSIMMNCEIFDIGSNFFLKKKLCGRSVMFAKNSDDQQKISKEGFHLYIFIDEIYVPRLWVETHPETKTKACMMTFYPDFKCQQIKPHEVLIVIDASNSMKLDAFENAVKLSLLCLRLLSYSTSFNVVAFGSVFHELFPRPQLLTDKNRLLAETFIGCLAPNLGNTDLYQILRPNYLLLSTSSHIKNIFLISDGHINCQKDILNDLRKGDLRCRFFTFAISRSGDIDGRPLLSSGPRILKKVLILLTVHYMGSEYGGYVQLKRTPMDAVEYKKVYVALGIRIFRGRNI